MVEPKYKRILIKLSGEALAGEKGVGIDIQTVQKMAEEIKEVHDLGVQIALVIGGGNLWRGEPAAEAGMDRVQADYTGMLGTVMNALVMADSLQQVGVDTRVQTAIAMQQVAEPISEVGLFVIWKKAVSSFSVQVLVLLIFQLIQPLPCAQQRLKQMRFLWPKMAWTVSIMPILRKTRPPLSLMN